MPLFGGHTKPQQQQQQQPVNTGQQGASLAASQNYNYTVTANNPGYNYANTNAGTSYAAVSGVPGNLSNQQQGYYGYGNTNQVNPPAGASNQNNTSQSSGGGYTLAAFQHWLGTFIGSTSAANASAWSRWKADRLGWLSGELATAERLESQAKQHGNEAERLKREAALRRQRAVAYGADPANARLGASTQ